MVDSGQVAAIRELVEKHKAKAKAAEETSPVEESKGTDDLKEKKVKEIVIDGGDQEDIKMLEKNTTFEELGVCPEICDAVKKMGYENPSKI